MRFRSQLSGLIGLLLLLGACSSGGDAPSQATGNTNQGTSGQGSNPVSATFERIALSGPALDGSFCWVSGTQSQQMADESRSRPKRSGCFESTVPSIRAILRPRPRSLRLPSAKSYSGRVWVEDCVVSCGEYSARLKCHCNTRCGSGPCIDPGAETGFEPWLEPWPLVPWLVLPVV